MSMIETLSDENNSFLSRREITCDFKALGGKLKKLEAIDMITKEFKLDGKIVIPIKLQNYTGQPKITGTFYVYDDEKLAREHVNPVIFERLEKAKKAGEEKKDENDANNRVSGNIKTKSFESSCSFFGINFSFINLASIQFDFTIILKKSDLV